MTLICGEALYDANNDPRWYEHHQFRDFCDFAILPITLNENCRYYFVNTASNKVEITSKTSSLKNANGFVDDEECEICIPVGERVNVIGYPFGAFTGSGFPLWTGGYISCEPEMVGEANCIFIDCRARQGQSGSPVYFVGEGQIPQRNGVSIMLDGRVFSFIGIYVGRINKDSDIGIVWPAEAIHSTLLRIKGLPRASIPEERATKFGGPLARIGLPVA